MASTELTIRDDLEALENTGMVRFGDRSLEIDSDLSYENYARLGTVLTLFYRANRWWLVDWLIYGEQHSTFQEKVDQAVSVTGLSERRIKNLRSIGMAIPPSRRVLELSVDWHSEVVGLKPSDQRRWLSRAKKELAKDPSFTQRRLRLLIREEQEARGEQTNGKVTVREHRRAQPGEGEQPALPDSFVLRGALCRRLVNEAVGTGEAGWVKVPRDCVNELAEVIGADPV